MASKEISIIKDYWDFRSYRVQVATGFFMLTATVLAISLLCGALDWQNSKLALLNLTNSSVLIENLEFSYLINLLLHIVTSFFVGLTLLEISKHYGSRWGASHCVWAAILFVVNPTSVIILHAVDSTRIASGMFLSVFGIFCFFRYLNQKENTFLTTTCLALTLSLAVSPVTGIIGLAAIGLSRIAVYGKPALSSISNSNFLRVLKFLIIFSIPWIIGGKLLTSPSFFSTLFGDGVIYSLTSSPESLVNLSSNKLLRLVFQISSIVILSVFSLRVLAGSIWLRPAIFSFLWLISSFIISIGFSDSNNILLGSTIPYSVILYYLAPSLSLLITLVALPITDVVNKPVALLLSTLGCLYLSLLFLFWGNNFYQLNMNDYKIKQQFKTYKTVSEKTILSYPNKTVTLIGFPHSLKNYFDSHRLIYGSKWTDKFIYADKLTTKANRITSFACSLKNQSLPPVYLKWNDQKEIFVPLRHSGLEQFQVSASGLARNISISPDTVPVVGKDEFSHVKLNQPFLSTSSDTIEIIPGNYPVVLWLTCQTPLNPTKCNNLKIEGEMRSSSTRKREKPALKLIFLGDTDKKQFSENLNPFTKGILINSLWKLPDWIGQSSIPRVGIEFAPGDYSVRISKICFFDKAPDNQ